MILIMDVEQSNRAPAATRATLRAAAYTLLLITSPFTVPAALFGICFLCWLIWTFIAEGIWFRGIVGVCIAAVAIRGFVSWLNRHHSRNPPEPP